MEDETASSYYQPIPEKISLSSKMNLLRKVNYWKLVPILKIFNGRRYKREAKLLIEVGQIFAGRGQVLIRYEIKGGVASFDISPDQGESYLTYLRGNVTDSATETSKDIVNSIATIEAILKTKNYLIY
jgi:hypothetical protein